MYERVKLIARSRERVYVKAESQQVPLNAITYTAVKGRTLREEEQILVIASSSYEYILFATRTPEKGSGLLLCIAPDVGCMDMAGRKNNSTHNLCRCYLRDMIYNEAM